MLERRFLLAFEFGNDPLRQHLAEFHAPLVKRVDLPHDSLGEDGVLVEGNQFTQNVGSKFLGEDGIGWTVAFKNAMRLAEGEPTARRAHQKRKRPRSSSVWLPPVREAILDRATSPARASA